MISPHASRIFNEEMKSTTKVSIPHIRILANHLSSHSEYKIKAADLINKLHCGSPYGHQ